MEYLKHLVLKSNEELLENLMGLACESERFSDNNPLALIEEQIEIVKQEILDRMKNT